MNKYLVVTARKMNKYLVVTARCQFHEVKAAELEIDDGHLIFSDHYGCVIRAYPPGRWKGVEKKKDE